MKSIPNDRFFVKLFMAIPASCENWNAVCFIAKEVLIQQRIMERARTAEMYLPLSCNT